MNNDNKRSREYDEPDSTTGNRHEPANKIAKMDQEITDNTDGCNNQSINDLWLNIPDVSNKNTNKQILTFKKQHLFNTYGYGYNIESMANHSILTTSLCEIPWNRIFMYLNPSELEQLQRGTYATKAKIKITQLACRTAFDTNASTTTIAVQNENQIGMIGYGLNKVNGLPITTRKVTAVDDTFKIQQTSNSDYENIIKKMYGVSNKDEEFEYTLPDVITNNPTELDHYLSIWNNKKNVTQSWYPINNKILKYIYNTKNQTTILETEYIFDNAPLTKQKDFLEINPYMKIPNTSNTSLTQNITTDQEGNIALTQTNMNGTEKTYNRKIKLEEIMEKGSISMGLNKKVNSNKIQPTIHIGIAPIYKKGNHTDESKELINTQTTYSIDTELTCEYHTENMDLHYNKIHTNLENINFGYVSEPNVDKITVNKTYQIM